MAKDTHMPLETRKLLKECAKDKEAFERLVHVFSEQERLRKEQAERLADALADVHKKTDLLLHVSEKAQAPVSGVAGMAKDLSETGLDPKQLDVVETIRSSTDGLAALLNDVRDLARLETGALEADIVAFNLRAAAKDSLQLFALEAEQKGIRLIHRHDSELPEMAYGDSSRLRQMLINLLSNAVESTEEGEIVVSCRMASNTPDSPPPVYMASQLPKPSASDGNVFTFECSVKDPGTDAGEALKRLTFVPFQLSQSGEGLEIGGNSLGLVICKKLAKFFGGDLVVESDKDGGATFTLSIELFHKKEAREKRGELGFLERKILLGAESKTILRVIQNGLRKWGVSVMASSSHEEIGSWVKGEYRFDALILDASMNGLDGRPLFDLLSETVARTKLPLLLLTGTATPPIAEASHVSAQLAKPVNVSELYQALLPLFGHGGEGEVNVASFIDKNLKILLAEDNRVNQIVAKNLFNRLKINVDIAETGLAVLEKIRQTSYEVIFMDLLMPEMDGLDAARQIRETLPAERQPFIVAMTGNSLVKDRQRSLEVGMDFYITKPAKFDEVSVALVEASRKLKRR